MNEKQLYIVLSVTQIKTLLKAAKSESKARYGKVVGQTTIVLHPILADHIDKDCQLDDRKLIEEAGAIAFEAEGRFTIRCHNEVNAVNNLR